jgi:hypothetical protein
LIYTLKVFFFFKIYNHLFKIKCESSGYPPSLDTAVEKQKYTDSFKEVKGNTLNPEDTVFISGHRALTKLLVTTLWGKLSLRHDLSQFKMVQDSSRI